jgi:hypothetical protein
VVSLSIKIQCAAVYHFIFCFLNIMSHVMLFTSTDCLG